jgi:transposase-like protein
VVKRRGKSRAKKPTATTKKQGKALPKKKKPPQPAAPVEDIPESKPRPAHPRRTFPPKDMQTAVDPNTGELLIVNAYDKYPQAFRHLAKMMYVSGQSTPVEISRRLGIPIGTIRSWSARDKWVSMRRQVTRIASKESVRQARLAMSNYIKDIDRGLNSLLNDLNDRLEDVEDDNKLKSEGQILRYLLEIWRMKIQLVRTLTYGVQGKAFTPHHTNLIFDDTQATTPPKLFQQTNMEEIVQSIPAHMQETAKFVLGFSVDELDEDTIDAVEAHLETVKAKEAARLGTKKSVVDDDSDFDIVDDMLDMEDDQ